LLPDTVLKNIPKCFGGQDRGPDPTGKRRAFSRPSIAGLGGHFLVERRRGGYEKGGEVKGKEGCGRGSEGNWSQKGGLCLHPRNGVAPALLAGYFPDVVPR